MNDSQSIKFRSCNRERGVAWNIPRCKLGSCYFSSITWPLPLPTLPSSWVYLSFLTISEASQRQIGISRLSSLFSCPPQHRPRYNYILLFAPQKLPSFGLSDTPISAKFQSICILVSDNCSVFVLFLADRACRLCKSHFVTQPLVSGLEHHHHHLHGNPPHPGHSGGVKSCIKSCTWTLVVLYNAQKASESRDRIGT